MEFMPRMLAAEEELIVMRGYLCRVGEITEIVLSGGYEVLLAYFQGILQ